MDEPHFKLRRLRSSVESNQSEYLPLDPKYKENQIPYEELNLDTATVLGQGAFGYVYKVEWKGRFVAVKDMKGGEKELVAFMDEAELMRKLPNHPNVVTFIGVVVDPFCIVTEYLCNGNLWTYLSNPANQISKARKLQFIKGIAAGMAHLTKQGIVHRDLAARNVLLDEDLTAKVSDFGLSRFMGSSDVVYSKSEIGPLVWMAPESLKFKTYSEKSDVWAFGVCSTEIITRSRPYNNMDAVQVATRVVSEGIVPMVPPEAGMELREIINKCFEYEPQKRPSFSQLLENLELIHENE